MLIGPTRPILRLNYSVSECRVMIVCVHVATVILLLFQLTGLVMMDT